MSDVSLTPVEERGIASSLYDILYEGEKIPTIVVENFPALGKLIAMRFIEWVQHNPGGVISLPTGKTPEHFIKWVTHILHHWDEPKVQEEMRSFGIDPSVRCDMKSLIFVQIDEFYPINPKQKNSFFHYVNNYYIHGFGLDPEKAMLIDPSKIGLDAGQSLEQVWPDNVVDLSLRFRSAHTAQEHMQQRALRRIDQWCQEYEDRIQAAGGIGFFLGGIGPDGHIGFNVQGSDHFSTTRLCHTNYMTQAAAAGDLGGIEIARQRLVITIGLRTITANPDCTAIIIAAGEAKSSVVADAVQREKPAVDCPASSLHRLRNARFYITQGAASMLSARQYAQLCKQECCTDMQVETALIDVACKRGVRLLDLTPADIESDRVASAVLARRSESLAELRQKAHDSMLSKIERGIAAIHSTTFLHTEPHHDDIMLGYLPAVMRNLHPTNRHHFATMTSGFTSVTNHFLRSRLDYVAALMKTSKFDHLWGTGYFHTPGRESADRQEDVWVFLDGIALNDEEMKHEGIARRTIRNLVDVYRPASIDDLRTRVLRSLRRYLDAAYPGMKDEIEVQKLKGMCREWEADCLWGYFGWNCTNIRHLRLGFYQGDIFTEEPREDRDVQPIQALLREIAPQIVTCALDPEGAGPDTHYKVLQAVAGALAADDKERGEGEAPPQVWGYRNVWYRFHPAEANVYAPVSLTTFSVLRSSFMNSFESQKLASFPSYMLDGPFCDLAQQIQADQYQKIKTCLGEEWFHSHPSSDIRSTRGFVFLQQLDVASFCRRARELRSALQSSKV